MNNQIKEKKRQMLINRIRSAVSGNKISSKQIRRSIAKIYTEIQKNKQ